MNEQIRKLAFDMLLKDEGLKLRPYRCPAGKLTIGIGHNIEDNGISQSVANIMFQEDLEACAAAAGRAFLHFAEFSEPRQLAILNMLFNLGESRFCKFKNTIAHIRSGRWSEAADEVLNSDAARALPHRYNNIATMLRENRIPA